MFSPDRPFGMEPESKDLIVIDPAWQEELWGEDTGGKSAVSKYRLMPTDEIRKLPVRALASNHCWLFMWTIPTMLDVAMDILRYHWHFDYVTRVSWRKVSANGKPMLGPGRLVRSRHEDVLIGRVGAPPFRKPLDGLFDGVRREHSRKPEEFYAAVEAFALSERRADIFSRQRRPGWEGFGDQLDKFGETA